jgi:hypothetical protein
MFRQKRVLAAGSVDVDRSFGTDDLLPRVDGKRSILGQTPDSFVYGNRAVIEPKHRQAEIIVRQMRS